MKKVIAFFMCALICLSVCACTGEKANSDMSSSGISVSDLSSSEATISSDHSSSDEKTSSKPKGQNSSKNNTSKNNTSSKKNTLKNDRPIDGWLPITPVPDTSSNSGTSSKVNVSSAAPEPEYVLGVDYGVFLYDGVLIEMARDKDIVYLIYRNPNMLLAYDSNSFQIKKDITLPGAPAEIHVEGEQVQISFPELKSIGIYNKNTLEEIKSIILPNEVASFCFDEDLVYYTEYSQSCNVYRTNLTTNETVKATGYPFATSRFHQPKVLLNKEKGILYIGESSITSSTLHYYSTKDLTCMYASDGVENGTRKMFLIDNKVYWGPMVFDAENPTNPLYEYAGGTSIWSYMRYADEKYVVNTGRIYDRKTNQFVTSVEEFGEVVITESENLVASYHTDEGNFIFSFPKGMYIQ